ncbi:MAG TPA: ABC transporter ATP-binding protein [Gemmataceae bacterium]|nr:ABC transporter ATP-binding protein [Gemmataceae bacterium]
MPPVIALENVGKVYQTGSLQVHALHDVSLTIESGEFVAIVGASGSGKTTLLNILGCLDRPTSGVYRFDGEEISQLDRTQLAHLRNRKLGFVFQSFNLLQRYSAVENVGLPLVYAGVLPGERWRRAEEVLKLLGLGEHLHKMPTELSAGQQQRVAIARALINQSKVVLADEPTGNLDSRTGEEILREFQRLHKERKQTMILVTHDPNIDRWGPRMVTVSDGAVAG